LLQAHKCYALALLLLAVAKLQVSQHEKWNWAISQQEKVKNEITTQEKKNS
jgi:hypothetical protein